MTPRTRLGPVDLSDRLAHVWPEVEESLERYLRSRGISEQDASEICQEVAARALSTTPAFESAADLTTWSLVVARRIVVDEHRRRKRLSDGEVPDCSSPIDVEREVTAREAWAKVAILLAGMAPADRDLLLGSTALSHTERNRLYVRRHRLRSRLAAASGGLIGITVWLRRRMVSPRTEVVAASLAMLVPIVALVAIETRPLPQPDLPHIRPAAAQLMTTPLENPSAPKSVGTPAVTPEPVGTVRTWEVTTPVGRRRGWIYERDDRPPILCITDSRYVQDTCVGDTGVVPKLVNLDPFFGDED